MDGDDEEAPIDIGGDNVWLLGEVGRFADDVVFPIIQLYDQALSCLLNVGIHFLRDERHLIANGYGVCRANATNAEVAFDLALKDLSRIRFYGVTVSSISDD